ncbi:MAG: nitrate/nitrite transporter NrtS [Pseudomonadota bacterium]
MSPLTANDPFHLSVVTRATKTAGVVGSILIAINQGDLILDGRPINWWQAILTFVVPYCVSTYSSVAAMRESEKKDPPDTTD